MKASASAAGQYFHVHHLFKFYNKMHLKMAPHLFFKFRFQIEGWLELIGTPSVDQLIRLCLAL